MPTPHFWEFLFRQGFKLPWNLGQFLRSARPENCSLILGWIDSGQKWVALGPLGRRSAGLGNKPEGP